MKFRKSGIGFAEEKMVENEMIKNETKTKGRE